MTSLLLDTHALYWLASGEEALSNEALIAVGLAQAAGALFVSPISAWELSVATRKPRAVGRPHLGADPVDRWFRSATRALGARLAPIQQKISLEAARVVNETGHKDPGDCFLIATARMRGFSLATRDAVILGLSQARGDYLVTVAC